MRVPRYRYRMAEWAAATLALLAVPGFSRRVGDAELRRWLNENEARATLDPAVVQRHHTDRLSVAAQQASDLRRKVYGSLAWILSACAVAIAVIAALGWSLR